MAAWVVLLLGLGWTTGGRKQPFLLFLRGSRGQLSLPQVDPYQSTLFVLSQLTKAALFEEPTEEDEVGNWIWESELAAKV